MRVSESFATLLLRSARRSAPASGDLLFKRLRCAVLAGLFSAITALLVAWAFIVPIFQSPDEPVHADYAFSILTAGHLIHASDGTGTRIANNFTAYLIDSTDFYRIAFHGSMHVPPNYGSRAYFAELDREAPPFQAVKEAQNTSGKVNWLTAVYPFAYYALEAIVMGAAYHARGSITAAFFAGRLFSVFLTLCGLCIGYRVARLAGLRPSVAVMFTAAVAFFPLTTFIGSYIQPDTLGFFAVALSLWAIMECLRRPAAVMYPFIGMSLALLLLTKTQYFIPVAAATLFALLSLWASHKVRIQAIAGAIACLSLPVIVAAIFTRGVSSQATVHRMAGLHSEFGFTPVQQAAAGGVTHFVSFLSTGLWRAFDDYFISGQSWQSYWGTFGWLDVQMLFVNRPLTNVIHIGVVLVTLLTMLLSLIVVARNIPRLKRIAAARGFSSSARIASRAVPFNSFALFVAIMMALYATTGNVFGAQGRNWYPFIIPSFLCYVLVAPEVTRRLKLRSFLRISAAGVFLCYSLLAAPMAFATVENRYYGRESLPVTAINVEKASHAPVSSNAGVVDYASCGDFNAMTSACVQPPNRNVTVNGWAVDLPQRDLGSMVFVLLDDRIVVPARYDLRRDDVARALHNTAYENAGFAATVPGAVLRSARVHRAQVIEVLADEVTYTKIGRPLLIRVSPIKVERRIVPSRMAITGFLDGIRPAPARRGQVVMLPAGRILRLSGWALGAQNQQLGAIVVTSDNKYVSQAEYPTSRPDVADSLHETEAQVGFSATIVGAKLGIGKHTLRVLAASLDGKLYGQVGHSILVNVTK